MKLTIKRNPDGQVEVWAPFGAPATIERNGHATGNWIDRYLGLHRVLKRRGSYDIKWGHSHFRLEVK